MWNHFRLLINVLPVQFWKGPYPIQLDTLAIPPAYFQWLCQNCNTVWGNQFVFENPKAMHKNRLLSVVRMQTAPSRLRSGVGLWRVSLLHLQKWCYRTGVPQPAKSHYRQQSCSLVSAPGGRLYKEKAAEKMKSVSIKALRRLKKHTI